MLTSNTIRFATDTFGAAQEFEEELIPTPEDPTPTPDPDAPDDPTPDEQQTFMKTALLKSKVPLDCTDVATVDQFVITGSEPEGSARRIIFQIDDVLYKFQSGQLVAYTAPGNFDDVIKWGNKISTLLAINNLPGFVGKQIYPIIALQAPSDAADFPTIKLGVNAQSNSQQLTNTQYSPVYSLGDDTQTIISITPVIETAGSGNVDVAVQLRKNGAWSAFMSLANATQAADAVRFRFQFSVQTVGSDSACVKSITIVHTNGQAVVSGNTCNLYSTVADYELGLHTAYCLVRHAPLVDAKIEAYVNFSAAPKHKELVQIGTGDGSRKEFTLPDSGVVANSIKLFQDGDPLYDFDFSTETSSVILTAAQNSVVTASYDYDYGQENWLLMTPEDPQPYNDDLGSYATRFFLANDADGLSVANVRIRLQRLSGTATENLGNATGKTQLFTLKHKPKPSTISFTNNVNFSFDEETGILSLVAPKNTALNVSYSWLGDAPIVYSFAAGFAV